MQNSKHTLRPTPEEVEKMRDSLSTLHEQSEPLSQLVVQVVTDEAVHPVELPESVNLLLREVLATLAQGRGIVVMPEETELTTAQAADLLKVSRPFLINLLESGEIPFHKVGSHRRVSLDDLLSYKERNLKKSQAILDELTALAQENDLYDL